jgi:hypothetical protein
VLEIGGGRPLRALEKAAGAAEEVAVGVVRLHREQVVEHVHRGRVVEEPPVREALAHKRQDRVGCDVEPRVIAGEDRLFGIRMHRHHERHHLHVVEDGVGESPEHELGLDPATVALDGGGIEGDETGKLTDRLLVLARLDELLALLRQARRHVCGGHGAGAARRRDGAWVGTGESGHHGSDRNQVA